MCALVSFHLVRIEAAKLLCQALEFLHWTWWTVNRSRTKIYIKILMGKEYCLTAIFSLQNATIHFWK